MVWNANQPYTPESRKIVWEVAQYLRGRGVDIGAGSFKILPHAIAVDNCIDSALFGIPVKPDVQVETAEKLDLFADGSMDWVYSSHLLEHLDDPLKALKEWWRILDFEGHFVLYLPHEDFYPKVGEPGANADHRHNLNEEVVLGWMEKVGGWDLIRRELRSQDDEYSFLLIFKKMRGNRRHYSHKEARPAKTACVVRYGAFGDMIQTSSVIAGLKKQGYHVTVFAAMPGAEVLIGNPHIDKMFLFDKEQVPNADLGSFWKYQSKKFDRWVNLSESVEGSLLAIDGRIAHTWTPAARHAYMNLNYLELMHKIAGVPHDPQVRFYPTADERLWAKRQRESMKCDAIVLWSLAGSSVHKAWAGLDNIIASILLHYPTTAIMLVGGPECVILEQGWENEPRVFSSSGKLHIRQTLAMLGEVDLVIGPETGVMNAACQMDVAKVLLLSHSTVENLSRDWANTTSVWSENTKCYGRGDNEAPACHMLHTRFDYCTRDAESGTAQCQVDISVEQVWNAVDVSLGRALEAKRKAA